MGKLPSFMCYTVVHILNLNWKSHNKSPGYLIFKSTYKKRKDFITAELHSKGVFIGWVTQLWFTKQTRNSFIKKWHSNKSCLPLWACYIMDILSAQVRKGHHVLEKENVPLPARSAPWDGRRQCGWARAGWPSPLLNNEHAQKQRSLTSLRTASCACD